MWLLPSSSSNFDLSNDEKVLDLLVRVPMLFSLKHELNIMPRILQLQFVRNIEFSISYKEV